MGNRTSTSSIRCRRDEDSASIPHCEWILDASPLGRGASGGIKQLLSENPEKKVCSLEGRPAEHRVAVVLDWSIPFLAIPFLSRLDKEELRQLSVPETAAPAELHKFAWHMLHPDEDLFPLFADLRIARHPRLLDALPSAPLGKSGFHRSAVFQERQERMAKTILDAFRSHGDDMMVLDALRDGGDLRPPIVRKLLAPENADLFEKVNGNAHGAFMLTDAIGRFCHSIGTATEMTVLLTRRGYFARRLDVAGVWADLLERLFKTLQEQPRTIVKTFLRCVRDADPSGADGRSMQNLVVYATEFMKNTKPHLFTERFADDIWDDMQELSRAAKEKDVQFIVHQDGSSTHYFPITKQTTA